MIPDIECNIKKAWTILWIQQKTYYLLCTSGNEAKQIHTQHFYVL